MRILILMIYLIPVPRHVSSKIAGESGNWPQFLIYEIDLDNRAQLAEVLKD